MKYYKKQEFTDGFMNWQMDYVNDDFHEVDLNPCSAEKDNEQNMYNNYIWFYLFT